MKRVYACTISDVIGDMLVLSNNNSPVSKFFIKILPYTPMSLFEHGQEVKLIKGGNDFRYLKILENFYKIENIH